MYEYNYENLYDYSYNYDASSSSDEDEHPICEKNFRPFIETLGTAEFRRRFRFTPRQFQLLLERIGPRLEPIAATNHSLTPARKLQIALRFYASNAWYYELQDMLGIFVFKQFLNDILKGLGRIQLCE